MPLLGHHFPQDLPVEILSLPINPLGNASPISMTVAGTADSIGSAGHETTAAHVCGRSLALRMHTATSRHHWDSTDALLADRKGDGGDGGVITDLLELVSYVVDISFGCE